MQHKCTTFRVHVNKANARTVLGVRTSDFSHAVNLGIPKVVVAGVVAGVVAVVVIPIDSVVNNNEFARFVWAPRVHNKAVKLPPPHITPSITVCLLPLLVEKGQNRYPKIIINVVKPLGQYAECRGWFLLLCAVADVRRRTLWLCGRWHVVVLGFMWKCGGKKSLKWSFFCARKLRNFVAQKCQKIT